MTASPSRWNSIPALLALAMMLGCQGLSVGSSTSPVTGVLTGAPASISFGNVPTGITQSQTDILTNTGSSSVTVTQATVSGAGFSTTGLSLPLTLAPHQTASFQIAFSPTTAGTVNGTLALANDGSTHFVNIPFSGRGTTPGSLNTNPTSFNFGTVAIGSSQIQTETVMNTGSQNLTISAASINGAFALSGLTLPLTLAPNQSSTFGVLFAPGTPGPTRGTLSLTVSGSNTSVDTALSGTGVLPGTLTASPTSLTFRDVQVGQNQTQTETVQNTGSTNVTISGSTASGTGFSITGISAPMTLMPGQSTSFSVTLTPPSAGNFSGSVSIASDASNPSFTIPLSGSGAAVGTLSVSSRVAVGNVVVGASGTATGTLTASGASVIVSSVSLGGTNPSEFSISGVTFPVTVTTSQPVPFTVTFTPGASGAASAAASFASNASNTPSGTSLTGTGTAAAGTLSVSSPVAVGNVVVGASGTATGTLTASGASVIVSSVSLGGTNPSEFSISGVTFPVTVTTSQPVPFTVTFTPGASGAASAAASFASNASNTPSGTSLTGTGTAAAGTLSVSSPVAVGNVVVGASGTATGTLTASGASVIVSSVSLGGTNPSEFSISGVTFPVTVTTSQPVPFTVTFTPGASGAASAAASFASNASNTPSGTSLTGTGTAAAGTLSVSSPVAVGNVVVGASGTATGTLTASGASVIVSSVSLGGTNPSEFSISGVTFPVTVTTSQPVPFTVTFTPGASGAASAAASFASNASNTPSGTSLTGTGTAAAGTLSVSSPVAVGNVVVGASGTATGTLTASGASVIVSSVSLGGTNPSEFSISGVTFPVTVTTSQPVPFTVTFTPGASGAASAAASFASNASNTPSGTSLTGTGTAAAGTLSVSSPVAVGNVVVGASGTATGTLTASGASVIVSSVSLGGTNPSEFSISGVTFPVTVTTSQPVPFTVTFTPGASGAASAAGSFASNASNTPSGTSLTGTGTAAAGTLSVSSPVAVGNVVVGASGTATGTLTASGASVIVSSVSLGGTNPSEFSISGVTFPVTVTTSQPVPFTVTFTPGASGAASAAASFASNASNTPSGTSLTGTGTAAAGTLSVSSPVAVGNVVVGASGTATGTLTASGASVIVSSVSLGGTNPSEFSISGVTFPVTVTTSQPVPFTVTFTPGASGAASAAASFASNASNTPSGASLTGTGTAAAGTLSVSSPVAVGNVVVGASGTATGTLTASGASVIVSSVSLGGTNPSEFSISGVTFPVTVTTSQPVPFTVTFTPGASGAASAAASFASNASNTPSGTSLTGTGTAAAGTLSVSSPVAVGNVVVGASGTATGTLTASGASVTVSSVSLGGTNPSEFSISGVTFPVTVTTSQPVPFTVTFTPGASGAASAAASFASNASNTPSGASLTGTGTPAPVYTVNLKWTASTTTGITSYNVYRVNYTSGACGTFPIGSPYGSTASTVTTFTDPTVTNGNAYCYATTAVDPSGESGVSNVIQVTIP